MALDKLTVKQTGVHEYDKFAFEIARKHELLDRLHDILLKSKDDISSHRGYKQLTEMMKDVEKSIDEIEFLSQEMKKTIKRLDR